MSNTYYRPQTDALPGICALADDLQPIPGQCKDAAIIFKGLGAADSARVIRKVGRATRRHLECIRRVERLIKQNQRWWADDDAGGWVYPPDVWYAIIAAADQMLAANDDMMAAYETWQRQIGGTR